MFEAKIPVDQMNMFKKEKLEYLNKNFKFNNQNLNLMKIVHKKKPEIDDENMIHHEAKIKSILNHSTHNLMSGNILSSINPAMHQNKFSAVDLKDNITPSNHYKSYSQISNYRKNAHSIKDLQHNIDRELKSNFSSIHKSYSNINSLIHNQNPTPLNKDKQHINIQNQENFNNINKIKQQPTKINSSYTNYINPNTSKIKSLKENYKVNQKQQTNIIPNSNSKVSPNYSIDFEKYKSQLLDKLTVNMNFKKVNNSGMMNSHIVNSLSTVNNSQTSNQFEKNNETHNLKIKKLTENINGINIKK